MLLSSAKKIIAVYLVLTLVLITFPWQNTLAYFSDTEIAPQNSIILGSLDFSLNSNGNFSPAVSPTQDSSRDISVVNDGSLNFQYKAEIDNLSGDLDLCHALDLTVTLGSLEVYHGSLTGFSLNPTTDLGSYNFSLSLTDDDLSLQHKTCHFDFIFTAWQDNLSDISAGGFSDIETISNTLQSGSWNGVVLNEILPNPEGDDSQAGLQGEWVEFYNNGDNAVDLTGWYIEDASNSGHRQTIDGTNTFNGRTVIGARGSGLEWVVLFMDGAILNNTGDTVTLYTADGQLVDSYSFGSSLADDDGDSNNTPGGNNSNPTGNETAGNEGKSYARIPDGTGDWVDPVPTPGGPNQIIATDNNGNDEDNKNCDENYFDSTAADNQSVSDNISSQPPSDNNLTDDENSGDNGDSNINNQEENQSQDSNQDKPADNSAGTENFVDQTTDGPDLIEEDIQGNQDSQDNQNSQNQEDEENVNPSDNNQAAVGQTESSNEDKQENIEQPAEENNSQTVETPVKDNADQTLSGSAQDNSGKDEGVKAPAEEDNGSENTAGDIAAATDSSEENIEATADNSNEEIAAPETATEESGTDGEAEE